MQAGQNPQLSKVEELAAELSTMDPKVGEVFKVASRSCEELKTIVTSISMTVQSKSLANNVKILTLFGFRQDFKKLLVQDKKNFESYKDLKEKRDKILFQLRDDLTLVIRDHKTIIPEEVQKESLEKLNYMLTNITAMIDTQAKMNTYKTLEDSRKFHTKYIKTIYMYIGEYWCTVHEKQMRLNSIKAKEAKEKEKEKEKERDEIVFESPSSSPMPSPQSPTRTIADPDPSTPSPEHSPPPSPKTSPTSSPEKKAPPPRGHSLTASTSSPSFTSLSPSLQVSVLPFTQFSHSSSVSSSSSSSTSALGASTSSSSSPSVNRKLFPSPSSSSS